MTTTTVNSAGLEETAVTTSLGYVPPATGYSTSTLFEFTVTAMHNGILGTGESYVVSSSDAFGVPLQDVKLYDMMEPVSAVKTLDLGSGETFVGE